MENNSENKYVCNSCGRIFTKQQQLASHIAHYHPKVEKIYCCYCKKLIYPYNYQHHLKHCFKKPLISPYKCKNCGKLVYVKFGSGNFCSRSCSNKRIRTIDIKRKISNTLTNELDVSYKASECSSIKARLIRRLLLVLRKKAGLSNNLLKKSVLKSHLTKIEYDKIRQEKRYADWLLFKQDKLIVSHSTAKKFLEDFEGHKCSICGTTVWNGRWLPMILDHIDGRAGNTVYSNLRLVCSNCDSQLPTYKSKNKNSDRNNKMKKVGWQSDLLHCS